MAGPALPTREHPHHSLRADGWLDTHCLRCGADGYWLGGKRIDPAGRATEIHPSGKTLVAARAVRPGFGSHMGRLRESLERGARAAARVSRKVRRDGP